MIRDYVWRAVTFTLIVSGVTVGAARAQDIPDLKGTWTGLGTGVAIGPSPYVAGSEGVHFPDVEFTIVIEQQKDRRFVGQIEAAGRKETIVGVIAPDLDEGVMVDADGYYNFELDDADTIELCYQHNLADSKLASCYRLTRSGSPQP